MDVAPITTCSSATDDGTVPPHVKAYGILIIRALDFLAANDIASSHRVARLLLRSPDVCDEHKSICHRILAHGSKTVVNDGETTYHTAQAVSMRAYKQSDVKLITIPPRTPRTQFNNTARAPLAPILKKHTDNSSSPTIQCTPPTPITKDAHWVPRARAPSTPIKKDDAWITTPPKTPNGTAAKPISSSGNKKKVRFVEPVDPLDPLKQNMKKPKVGKLFPELMARFEMQ
ncbi:hypothetical protein E4T48_05474 [Aureobasidium sp. EXF-10727]|nr:hypothetical protein E4T48_05474 [Aureobasidium sp. EXF-10727]KAI4730701.1 hypothetical protein E4T49_01624 [Aureobasidium sp. EXF-10728]